jgi:hypothetical protein
MFTLKPIWTPSLTFLLFALTAMVSPGAHANSVSADILVNGKPFRPAAVAAFRDREGRNPRNFLTYVVLTAKPLNTSEIKASLVPDHSVSEDPAGSGDKVSVWVHSDGTTEVNVQVDDDSYVGVVYPPGSPGPQSSAAELDATCKENTTTRVSCSFKTKKPVKTRDGKTCTFQISFDTDVLARPAGTPLAKSGEDAGKALLALYEAATGDDLDKIIALLLPKEVARKYNASYTLSLPFDHEFHPGDNLKMVKGGLDIQLPRRPTITGGERLADDHALLEVEGEGRFGRNLYLVDMRRLDGEWRFVNATLVGILN